MEGITFYKMGGVYYARAKSSLTGRRVKKDPRFARTMESAGRLALGSQLASRVYRALGKERRVYALYCTMKQMAILALKEGKGEAEVLAMMRGYLADAGVVRKARCKKAMRPPTVERKRGVCRRGPEV